MSRYIDADKTRADLWMHGMNMSGEYQGVWVRFKDIEMVFDSQPTADVVPVVRCKECKWCCHFTDGHIECRLIYDLKPVPRTYMRMRESDFCSYGERREVTEWD